MLSSNKQKYPYVDAHTHFHEYSEDVINKISQIKIVLFAVSDDIESSKKTISLSERYSFLIPCVGIHPWSFENINNSVDALINELQSLVEKYNIRCLGEVGLDKRYGKKTYNVQLKFLRDALEIASSMNLIVNIHALDSWHEMFSLLIEYDIKKAIFHWYTGPINLLKEIESQGYFITINPALIIQKKHRKIAEISEISHILTESDGPYEYHGIFLHSGLIPSLVKQLAQLKDIEEDALKQQLYDNFRKLLFE